MNCQPFEVALDTPLTTAAGRIERREGFLVGITVDGRRGVGEATPLPGWTEPLEECRRVLETVGAADVTAAVAGLTAAGADADPLPADAPAARHGLELAILDAVARGAEQPLAAWLAGGRGLSSPSPQVPVNATVGDAPPAATAAAATAAVGKGFASVKVKVGAGSLDRDIDRIRAVRETVGPAVTLRADANAAWDRETAAEAVEAFAPLDLAYVEQPLPPSDLSGHAALRGRGVGIAVDETLASRSVADVLAADAADVVVLKPMALGGPDRTLAAALRARTAGVDPVVTTTVDAAPARTAAVHVAAAIPEVRACGLATAALLADDLGPDPAPVVDGAVTVPTRPGVAGDAFDDLVG
jgi:o-succinylbenzoate synthase